MTLALIKNEITATFDSIIEYLKVNYNFEPKHYYGFI